MSKLTTVLLKSSRPAPKQKLLPFEWLANVDVELSGLNKEGMLYEAGDGDAEAKSC